MKKNVLICVAHRDDETIGCGGTIYKHFLQGDNVFCLSMTDGVSARSNVHTITKKKIKQSTRFDYFRKDVLYNLNSLKPLLMLEKPLAFFNVFCLLFTAFSISTSVMPA